MERDELKLVTNTTTVNLHFNRSRLSITKVLLFRYLMKNIRKKI